MTRNTPIYHDPDFPDDVSAPDDDDFSPPIGSVKPFPPRRNDASIVGVVAQDTTKLDRSAMMTALNAARKPKPYTCRVCGTRFEALRRSNGCSPTCRQRDFRRRKAILGEKASAGAVLDALGEALKAGDLSEAREFYTSYRAKLKFIALELSGS